MIERWWQYQYLDKDDIIRRYGKVQLPIDKPKKRKKRKKSYRYDKIKLYRLRIKWKKRRQQAMNNEQPIRRGKTKHLHAEYPLVIVDNDDNAMTTPVGLVEREAVDVGEMRLVSMKSVGIRVGEMTQARVCAGGER